MAYIAFSLAALFLLGLAHLMGRATVRAEDDRAAQLILDAYRARLSRVRRVHSAH